MRIFKTRGDIFFSKTNKEKSKEQKILLLFLVLIVTFTAAFVLMTGIKYDFSAKKFFRPEELKTTVAEQEDYKLPEVGGKYNFAVLVSGKKALLFGYILQVDMDNTAYKLCAVKAGTVIDGSALSQIYKQSGAENAVRQLETLFDADIDYYVAISSEAYADVFDDMGNINYPIISDIRYKNTRLPETLNFRIKSGEQSLRGTQVINLVRYYLDVENNPSIASDILLNALSQQMNGENLQNSEEIFRKLITNCDSNITIREFSKSGEMLEVLANDRNGARIYNASIEYKDDKPTEKSLKNARGYFAK